VIFSILLDLPLSLTLLSAMATLPSLLLILI